MKSSSNFELFYSPTAKTAYQQLSVGQQTIIDHGLDRIRVFGERCGEVQNGELAGCRKLSYAQANLQLLFRQQHGKVIILKLG